MSFVKRKYPSMTLRKGDAASRVIVMRDSQPYGKTNGIYADVNTSTALETLIAAMEAEMDGAIVKYACGEGTFADEEKVVPNDTVGDSMTKAFKVSFTDINETCTIVVPYFKATGNVATVAAAIKALGFKNGLDETLTVAAVSVPQNY